MGYVGFFQLGEQNSRGAQCHRANADEDCCKAYLGTKGSQSGPKSWSGVGVSLNTGIGTFTALPEPREMREGYQVCEATWIACGSLKTGNPPFLSWGSYRRRDVVASQAG